MVGWRGGALRGDRAESAILPPLNTVPGCCCTSGVCLSRAFCPTAFKGCYTGSRMGGVFCGMAVRLAVRASLSSRTSPAAPGSGVRAHGVPDRVDAWRTIDAGGRAYRRSAFAPPRAESSPASIAYRSAGAAFRLALVRYTGDQDGAWRKWFRVGGLVCSSARAISSIQR